MDHRCYSEVAPRLYQGSTPPPLWQGRGFDALALCAIEYQGQFPRFAGTVYRCPLEDAAPTTSEKRLAYQIAQAVADTLRSGRRVLIVCAAGLNRSGWVSAMALQFSTRLPLERILYLIRQARGPDALSNLYFVKVLEELEARRQEVLGRAAAS